jgi:hypothetical protein
MKQKNKNVSLTLINIDNISMKFVKNCEKLWKIVKNYDL